MNDSGPVLFSLGAEEALLTSLLIWDEAAALAHFADEDVWYDHLRPVFAAVRARVARSEPYGLIYLLHDLAPQLDSLSWRDLRGEALLVDLLDRHLADVWSYHGPGVASVVHGYALRRKGLGEAQNAAVRAYRATLNQQGRRHIGGTQFDDGEQPEGDL